MEGGLGEKVYRLLETRPRVLVNSLLESREKWKEKCGVSKVELQAFRGKVRDLEVSREKWRIQAEENDNLRRNLVQQLESSQAQIKQLEERLATSETEKDAASVIESTPVPGQHDSLEQISFVIQELNLNARTGFRAASQASRTDKDQSPACGPVIPGASFAAKQGTLYEPRFTAALGPSDTVGARSTSGNRVAT